MRSAKLQAAAVALALTLTFWFACVGAAPPSQSSSTVSVEGVLLVGEFFGPPNYGEDPGSDRIEHSFFLQLPAPLVTQSRDTATLPKALQEAPRTFFVQLIVFDAQQSIAKRLIGQKVKVVGTLFEPISGHHRTHVLVEVKSLSEIKEWKW